MSKTLCFTGHRPESLPFGDNGMDARCIRLKALLLSEIMRRAEEGYDAFLCGTARGADWLFGRQVLLAKLTAYPRIKLICVVPHEEQANRWSAAWRDRYFALLEQADDRVLIAHRYTPDCYHRRNRYMVDAADTVLAVYNGRGAGGTAYTVDYARRMGKEVVIIDPDMLKDRRDL